MVDPGGNLGGHDEHPVWCEDQYPVVRLVAALLQLDGGFEEDLDMFAEGLSDPLRGVFVDSGSPVHSVGEGWADEE